MGDPQAEKECRENPVSKNAFAYFATRNALLVTRARLKWLVEVRGHLGASSSRNSSAKILPP